MIQKIGGQQYAVEDSIYSLYCRLGSEGSVDRIDYDEVVFPYFPSRVNALYPLGEVSLSSFLNSHKNPKPEILEVFDAIESASKLGDKTTKDKLKQSKLYYFTPSVKVSKRCYDGIVGFNPLMVAEYDKVGLKEANRLKHAIFNRFDSCVCSYLSPSRDGCKFLFRIPTVRSVEEYKSYYYGLAYYLSRVDGFDNSNQSCVLPLFISYDTEMLIRPQEELGVWTARGFKKNSFPLSDYDAEHRDIGQVTGKDLQRVRWTISRQIAKCDEEQVGHTNVRTAGLICGGFVAAGYITEEEGVDYLMELIDQSDYLSKDYNNYKKTALTMIKRGITSPLYLD